MRPSSLPSFSRVSIQFGYDSFGLVSVRSHRPTNGSAANSALDAQRAANKTVFMTSSVYRSCYHGTSAKHMRYDYAIAGGGIVGLSTAVALNAKFPDARIVLVEKEDAFGEHQTGRNSGVIHSGIYYKPGSYKAFFCRDGNRTMVEFCQEYGIPYDICGKVIVAT